ncbi:MAG: hypothetical protein QM610_04130 [Chitinophagaceae bacterium]
MHNRYLKILLVILLFIAGNGIAMLHAASEHHASSGASAVYHSLVGRTRHAAFLEHHHKIPKAHTGHKAQKPPQFDVDSDDEDDTGYQQPQVSPGDDVFLCSNCLTSTDTYHVIHATALLFYSRPSFHSTPVYLLFRVIRI